MVFVWSRLTGGDPMFTLSQVALNDTIMVFAFAPIVALLLGLSSIVVPWDTLLISVVLYIVIPVIIAQVWRRSLLRRGQAAFDRALERIGPLSIAALLLTLVLLFAFQGQAILRQPLVIAMLAVPILIQVFFNSGLAYWLNRRVGEAQHRLSLRADRCVQLLRAGRGGRHQPVRLPLRCRAGHRGRRADRGAGDALGGARGQSFPRLVRTGNGVKGRSMKPIHTFLAVLVAIIWGIAFVVSKIGLESFTPHSSRPCALSLLHLPWWWCRGRIFPGAR